MPNSTTLAALAQIVSGLAGLAFVAAVVLGKLVFSGWGLNFAQLATPGDVAMLGVDLLLAAGFPLTATAIGVLIGPHIRAERRRPWKQVGSIALMVAGFLLAVRVSPPVAGGALFMLGLAMLTSPPRQTPTPEGPPLGNLASTRAFVLCGLVLAGQVAATTVWGLQERETYLQGAELPAGCAGQLLWLGEQAIVLDCASPFDARRRVIAINRPDKFRLAPGHLSPFEAQQERLRRLDAQAAKARQVPPKP